MTAFRTTVCVLDRRSSHTMNNYSSSQSSCAPPRAGDAYSDGNGWEEYFEPIGGVALREVYKSTPEASIIELSCSAAWYANEGVFFPVRGGDGLD